MPIVLFIYLTRFTSKSITCLHYQNGSVCISSGCFLLFFVFETFTGYENWLTTDSHCVVFSSILKQISQNVELTLTLKKNCPINCSNSNSLLNLCYMFYTIVYTNKYNVQMFERRSRLHVFVEKCTECIFQFEITPSLGRFAQSLFSMLCLIFFVNSFFKRGVVNLFRLIS